MEKQHILNEIRRTAKANGGDPLGRERFLTDTGIKQLDWYGKYWIRWGDAVREAGFIPNRLAEAYADEFLIERLVSLTRELGRFPVEGDLRVKCRSDPEFPSHGAFHRLGPKMQRVLIVTEFCRAHEGFQDVRDLCPEATDRRRYSPEKEAGSEEIGFIYLIKSGRYYKSAEATLRDDANTNLPSNFPKEPTRCTKSVRMILLALKHTGTTGLNRSVRMANGLNLSPFEIKAFCRRKFM